METLSNQKCCVLTTKLFLDTVQYCKSIKLLDSSLIKWKVSVDYAIAHLKSNVEGLTNLIFLEIMSWKVNMHLSVLWALMATIQSRNFKQSLQKAF